MNPKDRLLTILVCALIVVFYTFSTNRQPSHAAKPQARTLCAADERIIFSCTLRQPVKIVSVCAAKDLTNEKGYLQYRFGLPGKVELEFPKKLQGG